MVAGLSSITHPFFMKVSTHGHDDKLTAISYKVLLSNKAITSLYNNNPQKCFHKFRLYSCVDNILYIKKEENSQ